MRFVYSVRKIRDKSLSCPIWKHVPAAYGPEKGKEFSVQRIRLVAMSGIAILSIMSSWLMKRVGISINRSLMSPAFYEDFA